MKTTCKKCGTVIFYAGKAPELCYKCLKEKKELKHRKAFSKKEITIDADEDEVKSTDRFPYTKKK